MKIYLAGPLFSLAEREFNKIISNELEKKIPNCEVYLPQEFSKKILKKTEGEFFEKMFKQCIYSIDKSDLIVSILDGPDVDSGTCIELGYAYASKKPIIGVRTDFRSLEDKGVNLMVSKVCTEFIWYSGDSINLDGIVNEIIESIHKIIEGNFGYNLTVTPENSTSSA